MVSSSFRNNVRLKLRRSLLLKPIQLSSRRHFVLCSLLLRHVRHTSERPSIRSYEGHFMQIRWAAVVLIYFFCLSKLSAKVINRNIIMKHKCYSQRWYPFFSLRFWHTVDCWHISCIVWRWNIEGSVATESAGLINENIGLLYLGLSGN